MARPFQHIACAQERIDELKDIVRGLRRTPPSGLSAEVLMDMESNLQKFAGGLDTVRRFAKQDLARKAAMGRA